MRAIGAFGMCLIVMLSASAAADELQATPTERELREACSAYSEAGMRDCLADKVRESVRVLALAERDVGDALSKWDEDAKYIRSARAKLGVSGKTFAKYRDEQCAFAASIGGGAIGNALELRRLACVAELNDRRAEQLRHAVSDLSLK